MATVLVRVQAVVAEKLGIDQEEVVPGASFVDDLNADSLDLVELIMALEEEFSNNETKIEIPDEAAENIRTVANVVDYLKEHGIEDS